MPPTSTLHQSVVRWAKSKIGEREQPLGSNSGPFVISCQRATSLPGTGWPWCAAFARKAWLEAGREMPYTGASAYGLLAYYQQHLPKWVAQPWTNARPGAFVVFNIGAGHVALLASPILRGDTHVTTVGGNESDSVKQTTRSLSLVRGIVDPPELGVVPPPAKPKLFEVATSASGQRKVIYTATAGRIGQKIGRILNGKGRGGITITPRRAKKP